MLGCGVSAINVLRISRPGRDPEGKSLLIKDRMRVVERPWTCDSDQAPDSLRSAVDAESRWLPAAGSFGDGNVR